MTYGWAILVIAVVLASLFGLGVFNSGTSVVGTSCSSRIGYLCSNPVLLSNGLLSTTIGSSQPITVTGVACSSGSSSPSSFSSANIALAAGAQQNVDFPCSLSSNALGTPFAGTLWMQYAQNGQTGLVTQVASVNAKVAAFGSGGGGGGTTTVGTTTIGTTTTPSSSTYSFSATAGSGGSVSCRSSGSTIPCTGNYAAGNTITINAIPNSGNTFNYWTGTCAGSNPCTFTMPANAVDDSASFFATSSSAQYVAQFDGESGAISTGTTDFPFTTGSPNSFFTWVYVGATQGLSALFIYGGSGGNGPEAIALNVSSTHARLDYPDGADYEAAPFTLNSWHFVGFTYDGGTTVNLYVDGGSPETYTNVRQQDVGTNPSFIAYIGGVGAPVYGYYTQGYMSDAQFYATELSSSKVHALYTEGMGGTAMPASDLVGWWQLNNNANDYSGNGNTGTPSSGVTFVTIANVIPLSQITYAFSATPGSGGSVSCRSSGSTIPCTGNYAAGNTITLNAIPSSGYAFDSWTGTYSNSLNPWTLTLPANAVTETANFILTTPQLRTIATGQVAPMSVVVDSSGNVYWGGEGGNIKELPSGLSGNDNIITVASGQSNPNYVAVGDGNIYWINLGFSDTTNVVEYNSGSLWTGTGTPLALAAGNSKVYWSYWPYSGDSSLMEYPGGTLYTAHDVQPSSIVVSNGNIYWTDPSAIREYTSGSVVTLATGQDSPRSVAVDSSGNVYWANDGSYPNVGTIMELPSGKIGNANVITLASGLNQPGACCGSGFGIGTAVTNGNVYWITDDSEGHASLVQEMPSGMSGNDNVITIASGQNYADSIAAINGKVYWANLNDGTIMEYS